MSTAKEISFSFVFIWVVEAKIADISKPGHIKPRLTAWQDTASQNRASTDNCSAPEQRRVNLNLNTYKSES